MTSNRVRPKTATGPTGKFSSVAPPFLRIQAEYQGLVECSGLRQSPARKQTEVFLAGTVSFLAAMALGS